LITDRLLTPLGSNAREEACDRSQSPRPTEPKGRIRFAAIRFCGGFSGNSEADQAFLPERLDGNCGGEGNIGTQIDIARIQTDSFNDPRDVHQPTFRRLNRRQQFHLSGV
jgi:hypothetical protein